MIYAQSESRKRGKSQHISAGSCRIFACRSVRSMANDNYKLSDVQYDICDTQGKIFEVVARLYSHDSFKTFADAYMRSDFCKRQMDVSYSRYQVHDPEESLDFVIPEIEQHVKLFCDMDKPFPSDVAYWIGFTYRHISMKTCLDIAEIIECIPLQRMIAMYPGMHTLDETMALELIMFTFRLSFCNRKV